MSVLLSLLLTLLLLRHLAYVFGLVVYVLNAYDVTSQDKNMYYGQIQEIWEFYFHGSRFLFFVATGLMQSSVL
jgi:hypothetical protein